MHGPNSSKPPQILCSTRNKDVFQCTVGAEGFYLMYRFACSKEFDNERGHDLTKNDWFTIKLITSSGKELDTSAMSYDTYTTAFEKICKENSVKYPKKAQFGRHYGIIEMELAQVPREGVRLQGHWEEGVVDRHYGSQMHMGAMRAMAGFVEGEPYYLPRQHVKPCDELRSMVFPFIEYQRNQLQASGDRLKHPTAQAWLDSLDLLRDVILQDAAAMMVKDQWRDKARVFQLPVFKTSLFTVRKVLTLVTGSYTRL